MWSIEFISEQDFRTHVRNTIEEYKKALYAPMDLKTFNKNIIDPIKFTFDKFLYGLSWQDLINREIIRQKDKTINNSIGYFHQKIFQFIHRPGCRIVVPKNGELAFPEKGGLAGWDIAFENEDRIEIDQTTSVSRIYVEMKNKHNTMNSTSSRRTYDKMEKQILKDDDCACFLVEAIASESQNTKWIQKEGNNKKIRRVSIDVFYGIVTNDSLGFFKICKELPNMIQSVAKSEMYSSEKDKNNQVYRELIKSIGKARDCIDDYQLTMALYTLGFGTYKGFC
mgnify:CR=1 FL=1